MFTVLSFLCLFLRLFLQCLQPHKKIIFCN
uniref:Uncharacterized protein n=1 Tax=Siphoviridae sp. ct5jB2 TaxID=2825337 RepID=A0A8S5TTI6_9CAUD|nr:MAG TPA: hypothetical protein [Siphoviridae sp. ct5jB2]